MDDHASRPKRRGEPRLARIISSTGTHGAYLRRAVPRVPGRAPAIFDKDVGTAPKGQSAFSGVRAAATAVDARVAGGRVATRRCSTRPPSGARRDHPRHARSAAAARRSEVGGAEARGLRATGLDVRRRRYAFSGSIANGKAAVRGAGGARRSRRREVGELTAPQLDENHAPSCGGAARRALCRWRASRASRTASGRISRSSWTLCCADTCVRGVTRSSTSRRTRTTSTAKGSAGPATSASRVAPTALERFARLSRSGRTKPRRARGRRRRGGRRRHARGLRNEADAPAAAAAAQARALGARAARPPAGRSTGSDPAVRAVRRQGGDVNFGTRVSAARDRTCPRRGKA